MNHPIQEDKTPAELLPLFYEANHLEPDGGQSNSSVKIEIVKGIFFYMPNFDARRKAVLWHDIHHMLTGYSASSFIGECEISAWEIASGCKSYWAAFVIDTQGLYLGTLISPKKIMKAYARGRKTKNLYHNLVDTKTALSMKVGELKQLLFLDVYGKNVPVMFSDFISFFLFFLFAAVHAFLMILTIPPLIIYNMWMFLKGKKRMSSTTH